MIFHLLIIIVLTEFLLIFRYSALLAILAILEDRLIFNSIHARLIHGEEEQICLMFDR